MFTRRRLRPRASLIRDIAPGHGLPRPGRQAPHPPGRRFIRWQALTLLTVGSVGYLGSAPALSVYGLASVFLYVLPALLFFLPVSLVAAELASGWPGGVYNWVREGVSAPMGLPAVWCVITLIALLYAFIPSVSHAYWISPARLQGSCAGPGVRARRGVIRCRAGDRVRPAIAIRPLQPGQVRRPDPGRDSRHRHYPAAADGPAPQAGMEGSRRLLACSGKRGWAHGSYPVPRAVAARPRMRVSMASR